MIELKNSCCLHHVSGGNYSYGGDPDCPGCRGDWDDVNNQSANIGASVFSRDNAVRAGSWAGSIAAGVAASVTGIGTGSGVALGIAASEAGGALGGYIYDNPESARHPDYETPTGNIINNAFGY